MNKRNPKKRSRHKNKGQSANDRSSQSSSGHASRNKKDKKNNSKNSGFSSYKPKSGSKRYKKRKPRDGQAGSYSKSYRSSSNGRTNKQSTKGRGHRKIIDIQSFIHKASTAKPLKLQAIKHTFFDFGFCNDLQNNLKKREYTIPTPIQDRAIHPIMAGKDVVGLANTGTGKTGAFLLPLINKVASDPTIRVLIIAPTRELAIQIDTEFRKFSADMKIFSSVCIGGSPMFHQLRSLKRNPSLVIGTPGRLEDLAKRKQLDFKTFNCVVLDEVDRMLDMGFIHVIKKILENAAPNRQLLFFSATLPESIKKLVHKFLVNPVTVQVQTGQTAENVSHDVIRVKDILTKFDKLAEILSQPELTKVLIFSETKRDVEKLTTKLYQTGFKVDSIHGDKRQRQRQRSLTLFRDNKVNILVATDVAARGLDIKNVTHVINYTIPQSFDDYIHRIGRTGRGASKGIALTFV
jgi:ATP-dependent RNA helicase RhlE